MLVMVGAVVSMTMALLAASVVPATVREASFPAASRRDGVVPVRISCGPVTWVARSVEVSPAWTV